MPLYYASNMWNVLCAISTNIFYNEIKASELVSVHNYFIQTVYVIKWYSSLSLLCQASIAKCRYPLNSPGGAVY